MSKIENSVKEFFNSYPEAADEGVRLDNEDFEEMSWSTRLLLPRWYKSLLKAYPISEMNLGIPFDFEQPKLQGRPMEKLPLLDITFNSPDEIEDYSREAEPGNTLFKAGYICFARDESSSGDELFFNALRKDPTIYLVSHEDGESARALIKNATIITKSFSSLFQNAKVSNFDRVLPEAMKAEALKSTKGLIESVAGFLESQAIQTEKATELLQQPNEAITESEPIRAINLLTSNLTELKIKIPKALYEQFLSCYETCDLHIGELCDLEDLVQE